MATALPIFDVLDELLGALSASSSAVLLAPPGAGKTTVVPGALADRAGVEGQIWVLEPRRMAARLAAERVARERGGKVGDEVGYRVRFENRSSAKTRILFVTEGILTRRLVSDPFLEGIGAVVLDEFHERSIHADLGLAFLKEVQASRPELKVLVMSATLDPGPVSRFLGGCPIVESEGRAHPVEYIYLERPDERWVEDRVVAGVKRARRVAQGSILAFLPGAAEIRRSQRKLQDSFEGSVEVLPLYGELEAKAQDRAVEDPNGAQRIILATNVAESSLTIPGVDTVVDGGLAKVARYDASLGVDHLEVERISRHSADQRAGRAGRLGPGRAFRMWTEAEQRLLPVADVPDIRRIDLSPVVLQIAAWSGSDPLEFDWLEAPPEGAVRSASTLLRRLGAVDGFRVTPVGEVLAGLPVHPRLGKLLLAARAFGMIRAGARIAALSSERDVLRERGRLKDVVGSSDLLERLERLEQMDAGQSPESLGLDPNGARACLRNAERLARAVERAPKIALPSDARGEQALLRATLAGFPDRVARRQGDRLQLAEGGGARLAPESVVKDGDFLVVAQLSGRGAGKHAVATLASHVDPAWLETDAGGTETQSEARFDPKKQRVDVVRVTRFGRIDLSVRPDPKAAIDPSEALVEAARLDLDRALPITDALSGLFNRWRFLREHLPELDLPELGPETRLDILPEVAMGKKSFAELRQSDLRPFLLARAGALGARFEALAPLQMKIPSGRMAKLKYLPEGPPVLSVRLQEVFGLQKTPRVADGKVPIKMELLAPNMRPVQVTSDLASFWATTYAEVRKELRRRYPKHQWPEDPADGIASTRVRPRKSN